MQSLRLQAIIVTKTSIIDFKIAIEIHFCYLVAPSLWVMATLNDNYFQMRSNLARSPFFLFQLPTERRNDVWIGTKAEESGRRDKCGGWPGLRHAHSYQPENGHCIWRLVLCHHNRSLSVDSYNFSFALTTAAGVLTYVLVQESWSTVAFKSADWILCQALQNKLLQPWRKRHRLTCAHSPRPERGCLFDESRSVHTFYRGRAWVCAADQIL